MKRAQVLGVTIAGVCGLAAFFGVKALVNKPARVITQEVTNNTTQVLVAKTEIGLGQITSPENFSWQDWPSSGVNPSYVQRAARRAWTVAGPGCADLRFPRALPQHG